MSNAAIYLNPEAFNTSGAQLMGRQSAGEGFVKGFLQHAEIDTLHLWNVANQPTDALERMIARLEPGHAPIRWIERGNRAGLGAAGAVMMPNPRVAREAWARRSVGEHAYSICGITHTTASHDVTDYLSELAYGPVEPWDALICTSRAVRASVEAQIEAVSDYLAAQIGATRRSPVRLETIPLGTDTASFAQTPEQRRRWREELDIPADAVVALYVGRFNAQAKMNPVPMALALEGAARRTGRPLYWVASGWSASEAADARYHDAVRQACPSVEYRVVDGRRPDVRFSIWSVGDLFLSLSDNVQETFGLTPVEAMAAGLPSVISDWNGYRDTVRHGVDGFRITTCTPRPGLGGDLAFRHAQGWNSYEGYVGGASQFTSVDLGQATQAIVDLVQDPQLRLRMGQAAAERARQVFDWSVVIPQYQALWRDLAELRPKARRHRPRNQPDNPWRLDPYQLFASYPTEWLSAGAVLAPVAGVAPGAATEVRAWPINAMVVGVLPSAEELERILARVAGGSRVTVGEILGDFPPGRRPHVERSLLWMAKYGLLAVTPQGMQMPD